MDKKTYEALKEVIEIANRLSDFENLKKHKGAIRTVEEWMDEVAKDYEGPDATEY